MFQVKATVVGFMGDEEKYPCHFQHKIGDQFIYDGEKYIGRICPGLSTVLVPRMMDFFAAGPRMVPSPQYYYAFWYAPVSRRDATKKIYDGIGFRNVLQTAVEPPRHIARLQPKNAFNWPPDGKRTVMLDRSIVICGDTRTSLIMKVEAFDLADKGDSVTYFRREMSILQKVLAKPGIRVNRILDEYTREQIEGIYPALSPIMIQILSEELGLMGYLRISKGKATVTPKGEAKLKAFKKTLTGEERRALKM
ncbi:MAG: hypothetical protein JXA73_22160 [Acidobacteria bacterium]|nr:hypothetical protein [Acidobacteriota bacterium]